MRLDGIRVLDLTRLLPGPYATQLLAETFAHTSRNEWTDELGGESMTGPVLTLAEAFEHPQLAARGVVERSEDAPPRVAFPARGTEIPARTTGDVPGHGEHTDEVLPEAGVTEDEIASLREAGGIR